MTVQYFSTKGKIVTVVTNHYAGKELLKILVKQGIDILEIK